MLPQSGQNSESKTVLVTLTITISPYIYPYHSQFLLFKQLEEEVVNIYRVHDELKQTCERREKLERAALMRLQYDLQRVQELNCVMKDQVEVLQSQLLAPTEHQLLIAQLFTQSKCTHLLMEKIIIIIAFR